MTSVPASAWRISRDDLPPELRSIAVLPGDEPYAGLRIVPFRAAGELPPAPLRRK